MTSLPPHDHTDRLCLRAPSFADLRAVVTIHADPQTNVHNPHGQSTVDESPHDPHLAPPGAWGRGLATELARHAVLRASGFRPSADVVALARPSNEASIAVAEKAGLGRDGLISDAVGTQILLRRRPLGTA